MNSLPFSRSWWLWVRYFSQHRRSAWNEWSTFLESSCTTCEPTWSPLHKVKAEEWRKWKRTNTSGNQNGSKCCHTNSWFCTIVTADLWLKPTKTFNANEYWNQWYHYLWGTGFYLFCTMNMNLHPHRHFIYHSKDIGIVFETSVCTIFQENYIPMI